MRTAAAAIWAMFHGNRSDIVEVKPRNERETYLQSGPLLLTAKYTDPRALAARVVQYLNQQRAV